VHDAHQGVVWLGKFIRQRRESRGIRLRELADRTTKSVSALEKVENGTRSPGLEYLTELFDALGIAFNYRRFLVDGLFPGLLGRLYGPSRVPLSQQEKAFLDVIGAPAAYLYLPSGDVAATNQHWHRSILRLTGGANLLEWLFTDPIAKWVFPDWEQIAHNFAYGLKWLGPGALSPDRIEELRSKCSVNPSFDKMWNTEVDLNQPVTVLRVRDMAHGDIKSFDITIMEPSYPGRRKWMVYTLVPVTNDTAPVA